MSPETRDYLVKIYGHLEVASKRIAFLTATIVAVAALTSVGLLLQSARIDRVETQCAAARDAGAP